MWTFSKRLGTAVLATLAVLGVASPQADAQVVNPIYQVPFGVNPYARVGPNVTAIQAAYMTALRGQALQNVPPWALGYNPYPRPIFYGGGVPPLYGNAFANPYANQYNPYTAGAYGGYANPYTPPAGGYGGYGGSSNPYTPGGAYDGSTSNPYTSYGESPYGGFFRGTADVMRAQGTLMLEQEQARMLREQALQMRLETRKKTLETELWIKANTPTYSDEVAKIAKTTLKRIQTNASPAEILSGKALNVLLDDLRKHVGQKAAVGTAPVDEEVLWHLNVTKSGLGNLGLLRNNGQFSWPKALRDLADPAEKEMEVQAQALVSQARNGKVDDNVLSELKANVAKLRAQMSTKGDQIPTAQYMEGKRFLNSFEEALLALERGDAADYFAFQKFAGGGKPVQDVARYLVERGLRFAPAVAGDEAAYQAMHSILAAYDLAVNTQDVAAATPATKE